MKLETETISYDPDGDLILILTCPDESQSSDSAPDNTSTGEEPSSVTTENSPSDELISKEKALKEIRLLVSSKHMSLVSPVFKSMLQLDTFKEGHDLAKGNAEVPLPDDEPKAFQILLDIIHHRFRRVPKKLDLDVATEIAILVDKYQVHELVHLYSSIWIEGLRKSLPKSWAPEILSWLCISWVFDLADDFTHLTRIAQRESDGTFLDTAHLSHSKRDLPIPSRIFERIDTDRKKSINDAIGFIGSTVARYRGSIMCCGTTNFRKDDKLEKNYACDGTVLGSLLKSAATQRLWPPADFPCLGLSWNTVFYGIGALCIVALCDYVEYEPPEDPEPPKHPYGSSYSYRHSSNSYNSAPVNPAPIKRPPLNHGVKNNIVANTDAIGRRLYGLCLADFKK